MATIVCEVHLCLAVRGLVQLYVCSQIHFLVIMSLARYSCKEDVNRWDKITGMLSTSVQRHYGANDKKPKSLTALVLDH